MIALVGIRLDARPCNGDVMRCVHNHLITLVKPTVHGIGNSIACTCKLLEHILIGTEYGLKAAPEIGPPMGMPDNWTRLFFCDTTFAWLSSTRDAC